MVIPYLMLFPVQVTFAAAWRKSSRWLWRVSVVVSVLIAIVITCPGSPWFQGLGSPIPLPEADLSGFDFGSMETSILRPQLMLINAALIALFVCFPVSMASSIDNWMHRKSKESAAN